MAPKTVPVAGGRAPTEIQTQFVRNDELQILRPMYEGTVKKLADANVAVYPVDARGVAVAFPGADALLNDAETDALKEGGPGLAAEQNFLVRTSMQKFAEMTGARPCYHNNDFSTCLHEAVADSAFM